MDDKISKDSLLMAVRTERERWDALLAKVPEERMSEPGVEGVWSVKDVVAHITWHEREMLGMLRARALVGSDLWQLPTHERNNAIFEENQDRSLGDVLDEARRIYPELLDTLERLDEQDLTDPGRFAEMPADWLPWRIIAENTYEHYRDHATSLRAWLNGQG